MQLDKILEILAYTLPAVITGAVAYYFFDKHVAYENKRRQYLLKKEHLKLSTPIKLQAYERMLLFLERMSPDNLLLREKPLQQDKHTYAQRLIAVIEQEFEHNLTQQLYMTNTCWSMIKSAKNATIQSFRQKIDDENISSADNFRTSILEENLSEKHPTQAAINYLKNEVADMI